MSPYSPPRLPLVWVTTGKTQNAAYMIDEGPFECLVQWTSTQQIEQVRADRVQKSLSPRRRKSPDRLIDSTPVDMSKKQKVDRRTKPLMEHTDGPHRHSPSTSQSGSPPPRQSDSKKQRCSKQRKKFGNKSLFTKTDDDTVSLSESTQSFKVDEGVNDAHSTLAPQHQRWLGKERQTEKTGTTSLTEENKDSHDPSETLDVCETGTSAMTDDSLHSSSTSMAAPPPLCRVEQLDNAATTNAPESEELRRNANASSESSGFPLISSAYLQNLAEISNILTTDGRWRVGGNLSEPLLRWEDGVDLSAITYLSRCYVPPKRCVRSTGCACLLCRDASKTQGEDGKCAYTADISEADSGNEDTSPSLAIPDEDVRWLYIYCRLFYRRGPWFRIDDVYERYYKPKWPRAAMEQAEMDNEMVNPRPALSKENQGLVTANVGASVREVKGTVELDVEFLEKHLRCFADLTTDLSRLFKTGLLRTFRDEEECGKTAGVSVLTADMRNVVLAKLGGRKKSTNRAPSPSCSINAIWSQMKQQTSILASFSGENNKLLPVRKHVDDVVIDCLVTGILKSACNLDTASYLPASILKEHVLYVKRRILRLLRSLGQSHRSCFRLREEPYLALLRYCRLYLCATSGPGDMRSTETNGWKSLVATVGTPPLHKRIRRPGLATWCFVSYPGSLTRFGRASSFFTRSYIPVDPAQTDAAEKQIFFSHKRFIAWESTVELRSHVDYLLELTELVRYETRRSERDHGKNDGGRGNASLRGDSVDFLGLLYSEKGRYIMVRDFVETDLQASSVCDSISTLFDHSTKDKMREWEQLLIITASLCINVLIERQKSITESEILSLEAMPWMRHLFYEGCLAYVLWDLIPVLERFDLYDMAVMGLRLLVSGHTADHGLSFDNTTRLATLLLSRRARGKAYDRLIIDMNHLAKQRNSADEQMDEKEAIKRRPPNHSDFCKSILTRAAPAASLPFSAIRALARRLKQPLTETMRDCSSLEAEELSLRSSNPADSCIKKGYSDWTPLTDLAVANNVLGPDAGAGSRCVFVGHDDGSLNVEQLAMECYRSGKLPDPEHRSSDIAGWEGWHDEGGMLRAIFRIVCGPVLLGMDWGCDHGNSRAEHTMVYITPHQGAPFDLHVGFEISCIQDRQTASLKETESFYARRRHRIQSFLGKISCLSRQEISDLVFDSVQARLAFVVETGIKDPGLERDLKNVRTLSLVAAGCGGEQLSAIFRCLLFDYRHWSGGLPDLLLVRALVSDCDGTPTGLVDLSEFVGESFSAEFQLEMKNQAGAAMLADEEFLACSKVGDSGGTQFRSGRRGLQQQRATFSKTYSMEDLPERLELIFEGMCVVPECMMVEVKSSNDRLDPRQEDWLNVLDRYGNARVCKFEDSKKHKRRFDKEARPATKETK